MEMLRTEVLLLDDEKDALAFSRQAIARYVPEEMISCAGTVEEALQILHDKPVELAFLDIELTHSDGFTLCQHIHREYPAVKVVILTGHVDLGAQSYDYEPFDFLTKPVDVLRLERTFRRFREQRSKCPPERMVIEANNGLVVLAPEDILYISRGANTCQIHCTDGQEHRVACALDKLERMLAGHDFFRTHQSFLVPVARIRQMRAAKFGNSYEAVLDDGTAVPVSRNKYAKLKEYILHRSMRL